MSGLSAAQQQKLDELRYRIAEIQHGLTALIKLTDWLNWRVTEADRLLSEIAGDNLLGETPFPQRPPAQTA